VDSSAQQSLESLTLTVTLVTYHLGVLIKVGENNLPDSVQILFTSFLVVLNAYVIWCFSSCMYRDVMLDLVNSKVLGSREAVDAEAKLQRDVVHNELGTLHPQIQTLHPHMAKGLKSSAGVNRLRATITQSNAPDLWMKHVQLSMNLEMLRNSWQQVKTKSRRLSQKKRSPGEAVLRRRGSAVTEEGRQKQSELFLEGKQESINISDEIGIREPENKSKSGSILESFNAHDSKKLKRLGGGNDSLGSLASKSGTKNDSWRDRMEDSEWRVTQRTRYRLLSRSQGGTNI